MQSPLLHVFKQVVQLVKLDGFAAWNLKKSFILEHPKNYMTLLRS